MMSLLNERNCQIIQKGPNQSIIIKNQLVSVQAYRRFYGKHIGVGLEAVGMAVGFDVIVSQSTLLVGFTILVFVCSKW